MPNLWLNILLTISLATAMLLVFRLQPPFEQVLTGWKLSTLVAVSNASLIFLAICLVNWRQKGDLLLFVFVGTSFAAATQFFIRSLGDNW